VPPRLLRKYRPKLDAWRSHRLVTRHARWLQHPALWCFNRRSVSGAFAIGLFAGLIPGPFQMIGALLMAVPLRKNIPVALVTTFYTNPFTILPLYALAYGYGCLLLGVPASAKVDPLQMHVADLVAIGKPLGWGLLALATTLAVLGYAVVEIAWRIHLVRAWRRRKRA
jgi:uncharacterized protein (DUF2062 family)